MIAKQSHGQLKKFNSFTPKKYSMPATVIGAGFWVKKLKYYEAKIQISKQFNF